MILYNLSSPGNAVLRVPILYGHVKTLDESAVTVLFNKVKDNSKNCVMSDYERRYPTHCDDIAYVIRELSERRLKVKCYTCLEEDFEVLSWHIFLNCCCCEKNTHYPYLYHKGRHLLQVCLLTYR